MIITFGKSLEDDRHINKQITEPTNLECTIRSDVDLYEPTLLIKQFDENWNYFYVPGWNRYYFITSYEYTQKDIYKVQGHLDVLMSFKDAFLECTGLISESTTIDNYFDGGDYLSETNYESDTYVSDITFANTYSNILVAVGGGSK